MTRRGDPVRIALLGAESTGKSTLASQLATHFGGSVVKEALRAFCMRRGRTPGAHEQGRIARWQNALEVRAENQGAKLLWCDTTPLQTAVYDWVYFRRRNQPATLLEAHQQRYRLTLFCRTDLAWAHDDWQRDGEPWRSQFDHHLEQWLHGQSWAVEVCGHGTQRLDRAIEAVAALPMAQNGTIV